MEKFYQKNKSSMAIARFKIVDNKIVDVDRDHFNGLARGTNSRLKIMINMFRFHLSNIKSKISTTIYLTVYNWMEVEKFPVFGFAKPKSQIGILVPDWTFFESFKSKIRSHWSDQLKVISHKCKDISLDDKKNIVFFQGADSSKTKSKEYPATDIRRNLKNASMSDKKYKILIDDEPSSSVTEWCDYKYLLDLPGSSPWSVRFKELLMTKSLTIKIDIKDPWTNFYFNIFKPNEDYKEIIIPNPSNDENGKIISSKRVKREIDDIMSNTSKEEYLRMTNSAHVKMKALDNSILTFYFECVFLKYMDLFQ